jgi:hypothetical protein
MSLSPLAYADSLRIGTIDFVSPDEIKVLLDIEAPDNVATQYRHTAPLPAHQRLCVDPSDEGHLVAQVEWITIERSQYPKRKGMQDFGLVDLPYPLRKMSLNPLGVLAYEAKDADGNERISLPARCRKPTPPWAMRCCCPHKISCVPSSNPAKTAMC